MSLATSPAPITAASPKDAKEFHDCTNGLVKASHNATWYQASLSRVPTTANEIFKNYCGIPEDEILSHVHRVRDQAWEVLPYPCIGVFRFLDFPACLSPVYPEVLKRVSTGETFLDLGCCFGQDIRKLVHDGCKAENILGVDLESRFLDLGYDLFKDKDTLKAKFLAADIFDANFLADYRQKIDIIFVGSFLHLFSFEQQKVVVSQLDRLLRDRKGSLVFGRHMAKAENGGIYRIDSLGWSVYHHSPDTIRSLWETTSKHDWDVSSKLVEYRSEGWDNGVRWHGGEEIRQMYFAAVRK